MNGHALENRVELLEFEALGRVLLVFRGHVPGGPGLTAVLMLGAFHDDLYSLIFRFFRHRSVLF